MSIDAMKQALEAMEDHAKQYPHMQKGYTVDAITALRQAIEQAEQAQPVAWISHSDSLLSWDKFYDHMEPLYTTPPQRQPLTDEMLLYIYNQLPSWDMDMDKLPRSLREFARAIEAAHGIKE
jgi:hypothetical protein